MATKTKTLPWLADMDVRDLCEYLARQGVNLGARIGYPSQPTVFELLQRIDQRLAALREG